MSYLIDTNVVSELTKQRPNASVIEWFDAVPSEAIHLSVLTLGEIRKGAEAVRDPKKRERLRIWLEQTLPGWCGDRLLTIDAGVADRWGRLLAAVNRPVSAIDALIAATALHHELRLVTRNIEDFAFAGLETVDPWGA